MFLARFRESQDSLMTAKNPTPKLSEVDTTETAEAIKTLMAEDRNLDPVFQALVLEAMRRG